ncbi:Carrier domain-containing protein [Sulfidibacter corallicola]|uniref:Carrier domain-containing protein n=1 Tax=Sulfidibacter corallicola TaxID=2818388 RepID=A0A8A4TTC5_SULCO|nr:phosphopantetheine-binding protein [Sulfidibacter corallicola]QTD53209.1 hypothetical protein J3U87_12195 [Sulfidibacter corallicola]
MRNVPELAALAERVEAIIRDNTDKDQSIPHNIPLIKEAGLDSLDMIETSFALEEFFGFQFSDQNAIESLADRLEEGMLIDETASLTPLGREMVQKRMPELAHVDLPDPLRMVELQQYYTVETFARLMREFYLAAPDTCPESGEAVVLDGFKIVTVESRRTVEVPTGDQLIEAWVTKTAEELKQRA